MATHCCIILLFSSDQRRLRSSWAERCGRPVASQQPCPLSSSSSSCRPPSAASMTASRPLSASQQSGPSGGERAAPLSVLPPKHASCPICDLRLTPFSRYCDQLKLSESTHILQPFLPSVLEGLVQLAAQFSSEVLTLVMETLCIVCTVDPAFTISAENKICPLTIAIFLKYNNGTATDSALKVN